MQDRRLQHEAKESAARLVHEEKLLKIQLENSLKEKEIMGKVFSALLQKLPE